MHDLHEERPFTLHTTSTTFWPSALLSQLCWQSSSQGAVAVRLPIRQTNYFTQRCRNRREGIRLSDVITSFGSSNVKCFICNRMGHIAADCSERSKTRGGECYRCDGYGHISSTCPKIGTRDKSRKRSRPVYNSGNDRSSYSSNGYHGNPDSEYMSEHTKSTKHQKYSSGGRWKENFDSSESFNRLNTALSSAPSVFRRRR